MTIEEKAEWWKQNLKKCHGGHVTDISKLAERLKIRSNYV